MRITRRELVRAAAASGLAGAGLYELVEKLAPAPARAAGFPPHLPEQHVLNAVLKATHRQNFLVPPRAHRSFPLSELQA